MLSSSNMDLSFFPGLPEKTKLYSQVFLQSMIGSARSQYFFAVYIGKLRGLPKGCVPAE